MTRGKRKVEGEKKRERDLDLKASAGGARDGLLLVVLVLVGGRRGLAHDQTLRALSRHLLESD